MQAIIFISRKHNETLYRFVVMAPGNTKYYLIAGVILVAAAFGVWIGQRSVINSTSLPIIADINTDFELTGLGHTRIGLKNYRGQIVILFFGYTYCPDVCPTSLYTLQRVMTRLGTDSGKTQVLMITVDPERDSAERLQEYVSHFNPGFIGLTGSLKEITDVAKAYLTQFKKESPSPDGSYLVTHSAFFYVLDQQGRVRVLHDPLSTPEQITSDVRSLLAEPRGFIF